MRDREYIEKQLLGTEIKAVRLLTILEVLLDIRDLLINSKTNDNHPNK